jgi:hypothetical protein
MNTNNRWPSLRDPDYNRKVGGMGARARRWHLVRTLAGAVLVLFLVGFIWVNFCNLFFLGYGDEPCRKDNGLHYVSQIDKNGSVTYHTADYGGYPLSVKMFVWGAGIIFFGTGAVATFVSKMED